MALQAKPYLREVFIGPQAQIDFDRYPSLLSKTA
jgi:hypothetical protein